MGFEAWWNGKHRWNPLTTPSLEQKCEAAYNIGRREGMAEMRERAAKVCDDYPGIENRVKKYTDGKKRIGDAVRALPIE